MDTIIKLNDDNRYWAANDLCRLLFMATTTSNFAILYPALFYLLQTFLRGNDNYELQIKPTEAEAMKQEFENALQSINQKTKIKRNDLLQEFDQASKIINKL